MKITRKMIHPELRTRGTLIRLFWPCFTLWRIRLCNALLNTFGKGHAFTKKVRYEQVFIPRSDGGQLRLCVYTPKQRREAVPGLLWIHGGGYALGIPEQDYPFIQRFIEASECVVVAPDYTRSMDRPYPAALDDCYLALLWLKDHGAEYGVRTDQLFVGGNSAGGGLTAAISEYARDRGAVSIAFQMPLYPMLDDRMITESSQGNDAPVLSSRSCLIAWRQYLGKLHGTDDVPKYAAPARETDYRGLPPTLVFVGGIDPFRDETLRYVEALENEGIDVFFQLFDGCFHAFDLLKSSVSQYAIDFLMAGFSYAVEHYTKEQPTGQIAD